MSKTQPGESSRPDRDELFCREETQYNRKKTVLIAAGVILAVIAIIVAAGELIRFVKYRENRELCTAGQYERAIPGLIELGDYRECPILLSECYEVLAGRKLGEHEWDSAREYYAKAAEINGQYFQIQEVYMKEGRYRRNTGDWDGAAEAFALAGDYRDAKEQIRETRIQQAKALEEAGDPEGAAAILEALQNGEETDALPDAT